MGWLDIVTKATSAISAVGGTVLNLQTQKAALEEAKAKRAQTAAMYAAPQAPAPSPYMAPAVETGKDMLKNPMIWAAGVLVLILGAMMFFRRG